MDKVLALQCLIMAAMALFIIIAWVGYEKTLKKNKSEKKNEDNSSP